jgi:hypothetical protein
LIGALLDIDPEQSNRELERKTGIRREKIAAVRERGEATGQIRPVEKTKGKDGKKRPAKRKSAKTKRVGSSVVRLNGGPATSVPSESAEERSAHNLAEFAYACRLYLPKITVESDKEKARQLVDEELPLSAEERREMMGIDSALAKARRDDEP